MRNNRHPRPGLALEKQENKEKNGPVYWLTVPFDSTFMLPFIILNRVE